MNTVKRWLAGLLSFAMIFTSSAFMNVGTVFAAEEAPENQAAVQVMIEGTPSYWKTLKDAVTEANKAKASRSVTIKLLKDVTLESNADFGTVTHPLILDLNNYSLSGDTYMNPQVGKVAGSICNNYIYDGNTKAGYLFATHSTTTQYVWDYDETAKATEFDPIWKVKRVREICDNCGTGEETSAPGSTIYDENQKKYIYYEVSPLGSGYSYDKKDEMEATGYTIMSDDTVYSAKTTQGPVLAVDGSKIRHNAEGIPVPEVTVRKNEDGSIVDANVTITKSELSEYKYNNKWKLNPTTLKWEEKTGAEAQAITETDGDCTHNGKKIFKVVVQVGDEVLATRFFVDDQYPKGDHVAGPIKEIQLIKKAYKTSAPLIETWENRDGTIRKIPEGLYDGNSINAENYWLDEGQALEAGLKVAEDAFIETYAEKYDLLNAEGNPYTVGNLPDGVKETTIWSYKYWGSATITYGTANYCAKSNMYFDLTDAVDENGCFSYRTANYCLYEGCKEIEESYGGDDTLIYGKKVDVKPLDNEKTNADYKKNQELIADSNSYPEFSTCTRWIYAPFAVTFDYLAKKTDKVASQAAYTYTPGTRSGQNSHYGYVEKPVASHKLEEIQYDTITWGGTDYTGKQPTCDKDGYAYGTCTICKSTHPVKQVVPATGKHTPAEYPRGASENFNYDSWRIDDTLIYDHKVQIVRSEGIYTIAKVLPTCYERGGEYYYCQNNLSAIEKAEDDARTSGFGTGHWYLKSETPKLEHNLSDVIATGRWINADGSAATDALWKTPNANKDYIFEAFQDCSNPGCSGAIIRYHSLKGTDTETDKYGKVSYIVNAAGDNCLSYAKVVYTVAGLKDGNKNNGPVEYAITNSDEVGPHTIVAKKFKWSGDFERATAIGNCSLCKVVDLEDDAVVTRSTSEDGITTFTASYNGKEESKKAFTLSGAKVSFDETLITDGNLVSEWTEGAAQQVPEVTVTFTNNDGTTTVIDPKLYEATWDYNPQLKLVMVEVDWTDAVKKSGKAVYVENTATQFAKADSKKQFDVDFKIDRNGEKFNLYGNWYDSSVDDGYAWGDESFFVKYDPSKTYKVVPVVIPDDADVKLHVEDKPVNAKNWQTFKKKIEEFKYDVDPVEFELHNAGRKYIYAQFTKDGYTTYTTYLGFIEITKPAIYVQIDPLTVTVGEDPLPKLAKRAYSNEYETQGEVVDVNWDEDFVITTAGGKSLKDLDAGDYSLNVQAPNYNIQTTIDTNIGNLTVIPKDQEVIDAEQIAEELATAATDDALAAAYAKYLALSDELKKVVESNNAAKANLEKAKAAYEAKQAADKKAADQKAADNVINMLATVTDTMSKADAQKIVDAFNALTADQKALVNANPTAKANLAKAQSIANKSEGKKTAKITFKTKSPKKLKASKLKKKAQSFKIKATADSKGTVTFKKMKGSSKKIKISKKGKVTVKKGTKKGTYKLKVKATAAAKGNYKSTSKKKTYKIVVK